MNSLEKIQLFCIPYAGGKADDFYHLGECIDESIKIEAVEYSGHSKRIGEPFYNTFDEMVCDAAKQINDKINSDRIALFGYSMGSVVAYEIIANDLLKVKPYYLFIAAHEAPGEHWNSMEYADLDDKAFVDMLVNFGGIDRIDDKMIHNRFFQKMILNPIKADYNLISQYNLSSEKLLNIPCTMIYSPNDVTSVQASKWQNRFENQIEFIEIGNNHFFIKDEYQQLADIISKRLNLNN